MIDKVTNILTLKECEIFTEILYNREQALAWDFEHCGKVDQEVVPPQVIRTVPHKAWMAPVE
jgi:hypothetical protein